LSNVNADNPMDYEFPEIEEYFIYNPKMNYPTNNPSALGGTGGIKMTRDSVTYCSSGLVDRNKGSYTLISYIKQSSLSISSA
jgi:hypothetical protein